MNNHQIQPIAILQPPAKINLFLSIGSPRADGFHDLQSIIQTVQLCDRLTLHHSDSFEIICDTPGVPTGEENTLWKAYELFQKLCPQVPTFQIHLEKNIPHQAGLGGGSSDAGELLKYLWTTYAPEILEEKVVEIAAEVGSDIPFFIYGGTCLVEGRGEKITNLPCLPQTPVLLIHPEVSISTGLAFSQLDEIPDRQTPDIKNQLKAIQDKNWDIIKKEFFNSFEQVIFESHPEIKELILFCRNQGSSTLLSGSGSNVFAMNDNFESLKELQSSLQSKFPSWPTTLTTTIEN